MAYPKFPVSGLDRPLFFSTFDPSYRNQANDVFCDETNRSAGGGPLYNGYASGLAPTLLHWTPSWTMYDNAGNFALLTTPIVWAGWVGPRPIMWLGYAGGQVPD